MQTGSRRRNDGVEMRNPASRRWQSWRVAPAAQPADAPPVPALPNRLLRTGGIAEQPGPDGIRWGLVNRVRAEIAAGTYDTKEKWAAAEEALLRRVGEAV
jgi:hypothetical protein